MATQDINFRFFDEQTDLQNVVRFYNDVFAPLRPFYSWPISVARFRDKVLGCWEYKREGFWLAEHAGRLAGLVLASCRTQPLAADDNPRQAAHIAVLAVRPEYRLDADVPLMLEHLPNEEEYRLAAAHIRSVAAKEGLSV